MLLPLRLNLNRVRFDGANPSAGTRQDEEDMMAVLMCAMPIINHQRVGIRYPLLLLLKGADAFPAVTIN